MSVRETLNSTRAELIAQLFIKSGQLFLFELRAHDFVKFFFS